MEPQVQNGIKTWQWVVTAIIIVIIIIVGVLVFSNKNAEPLPVVTDNGNTIVPSPNDVNRIIMTDQNPGNIVYASSVQTTSGAWVVIQKDNNGKPGTVIGSTYASAGTAPLRITLSQPLVDGSLYYAVLYSGSSNRAFNAATNTSIVDSSGNIIMKPFHASATASAEIKG